VTTGDRRIGPYELRSLIGAGGMGEVYLARDTRLGRDVAIKMLPPGVAHDAERIRRFQREARTLASLNHPNIAHVYGVEDTADNGALVMEFVEGPTLADRIARGPVPPDEALPIARQIAEALEYAHERGIVHRDLKPANVKLTPDGSVKVLDFGLAKALAPDLSAKEGSGTFDSPTVCYDGVEGPAAAVDSPGPDPLTTRLGTVLGTTSYMAPEQARGRTVDRRADIWAFGCVLFEMLTGRRAFVGNTTSDTVAAILTSSTDVALLPRETPASVRLLLARCLERDPRRRLRDIGEARVLLEDTAAGKDAPAIRDEAASPVGRHAGWRPIAWVLAALALVGIAAMVGMTRRTGGALPPLQADLAPPPQSHFQLRGDMAAPPVLSPDGSHLAFGATETGRGRLFVRSLAAGEVRALDGTDEATFPFFSPDGRSIGFFAGGKLKRIAVDGGSPLTVCDAPNGRGGAWAPDGTIVFSPGFRTALARVRATGSTPEPLTTLDAARHSTHRWPSITADGRHVVYFAATHVFQSGDANQLRIVGLDGGNDRVLLSAQGSGEVVGPLLLFPRESTLVAQRLDVEQARLEGEPRVVASGVLVDSSTWRSVFSVSADRLVLAPSAIGEDSRLTRVDRAGRTLAEIAAGAPFRDIRLSPDGRRLIAIRGAPGDLWLFDLERGTSSRFTVEPTNEEVALWSRDGRWVFYMTTRSEERRGRLYRKDAGGAGQTELLFQTTDRRDIYPTDISRDGSQLLVQIGTSPFLDDSAISVLSLGDTPTLTPLVTGPYAVRGATYSPDGRWIAYTSSESGTPQVYVVPAPGAAATGKWQVSVDSGNSPLWSSDGRELFFVDNASALRSASVGTEGRESLRFSTPVPLFSATFSAEGRAVAAMPDGQSFLVNHRGDAQLEMLRLVQQWANGGR
jgi:Tol biopolymer transport system component